GRIDRDFIVVLVDLLVSRSPESISGLAYFHLAIVNDDHIKAIGESLKRISVQVEVKRRMPPQFSSADIGTQQYIKSFIVDVHSGSELSGIAVFQWNWNPQNRVLLRFGIE